MQVLGPRLLMRVMSQHQVCLLCQSLSCPSQPGILATWRVAVQTRRGEHGGCIRLTGFTTGRKGEFTVPCTKTREHDIGIWGVHLNIAQCRAKFRMYSNDVTNPFGLGRPLPSLEGQKNNSPTVLNHPTCTPTNFGSGWHGPERKNSFLYEQRVTISMLVSPSVVAS